MAMTSIPFKTLKRIRRWWRRQGDVPVRLKTAAIKLRNRDLADQPVWIGRNGRLELEDGATLQLGGDLVIGDLKRRKKKKKRGKGIKKTIGPVPFAPATLRMSRNSRLETRGWVTMEPGASIVIGPGATLRMEGENNVIGTILCSDLIEIDEMSGVSWDASVMDSDMHPITIDGETKPYKAPIKIGKHVWVGSGARILKGVTVGDGAVIATGSIVTKDVPARCLVAGVPARVIRKNVDWS
jgi:carbonic anhydrase/acetyltransferase-like protein (isoleucine patch superfamily)